MTQAFWTAALPNMKDPPNLRGLLVPVDDAPARRKMDWQAIKAAMQIALPPEETR